MSAFQVEEKILYNVITLIHKTYGGGKHYLKNQELKQLAHQNVKKLFSKLSKLNNLSLKERYDHSSKDMISNLTFNIDDHIKASHESDFQLIKSTQCFLYQSCEGKASKTSLHTSVEYMCGEYALSTLSKNTEYQKAIW
jgi:hypothetical protein|tara:strand:+ start:43 stop:459 length:417 start_codon:yes stop_codon:yes gene_type:complete